MPEQLVKLFFGQEALAGRAGLEQANLWPELNLAIFVRNSQHAAEECERAVHGSVGVARLEERLSKLAGRVGRDSCNRVPCEERVHGLEAPDCVFAILHRLQRLVPTLDVVRDEGGAEVFVVDFLHVARELDATVFINEQVAEDLLRLLLDLSPRRDALRLAFRAVDLCVPESAALEFEETARPSLALCHVAPQ